MNKKVFGPIFLFSSLLVLAALACQQDISKAPTSEPIPTSTAVPSPTPLPPPGGTEIKEGVGIQTGEFKLFWGSVVEGEWTYPGLMIQRLDEEPRLVYKQMELSLFSRTTALITYDGQNVGSVFYDGSLYFYPDNYITPTPLPTVWPPVPQY